MAHYELILDEADHGEPDAQYALEYEGMPEWVDLDQVRSWKRSEEQLKEVLDWLRKDYLPRISREFENHIAQPFILSFASKFLSKYAGSQVSQPPVGLTDKVAQIMAMDMDPDEKERLLASVIAKEQK